MTSTGSRTLLLATEPPPVRVTNPAGASLFLLVGDHAGNLCPQGLGNLGLSEIDRRRHIALDIGVSQLGRDLAGLLDAVFIEQPYSRLVVDCNRARNAADSIPQISDGTPIDANAGLSGQERDFRYSEIFDPYHAAIAAELDRRAAIGRKTVFVSLHSFTPIMNSERRPWDIGVLHDAGDTAFALALFNHIAAAGDYCVGDNAPYKMDGTDHTVPAHAYPRQLPYVELEIRQDHLRDQPGVDAISLYLGGALRHVARSL